VNDRLRTRFPGYDVLAKWDSPSWNEITREVVRRRLQEVPERRFLTLEEWSTLEAVCDRIIPQPDRPFDAVPIVPWIDRKLDRNEGEGYRYEDMPPLRDAWRVGIAGIGKESHRRFDNRFPDLSAAQQDAILRAIQEGAADGDPWEELPSRRFFQTLTQTILSV
jgi:hypothetical protein